VPIFISQGRYSQAAMKAMLARPEDRSEAVAQLFTSAGAKLLNYYVTFGEYDFLLIVEAPGEQEILSALAVAAAAGAVESFTTTLAVTTAQAKQAFAAAGQITMSYRPPGQA
jgi:uncharacterized protein with GYD domain